MGDRILFYIDFLLCFFLFSLIQLKQETHLKERSILMRQENESPDKSKRNVIILSRHDSEFDSW